MMNLNKKNIYDVVNQACILSVASANGTILHVNDHFCKLSGYHAEELVGKNHNILNSRHHRKHFFKDLWRSISKGDIWQGLICNKNKNGDLYWVNTTIQPSLDSFGKVESYLAILFDVTTYVEDQKKLKSTSDELKQLKIALDQFAIVERTDSKGIIEYVNDRFCEISGYSKDELIGSDHRMVNSGYHHKRFFKEIWESISDGKVWNGQIKNISKSGKLYWVDTTITPVFDATKEGIKKSTPTQYVAIAKDITREKRLEQETKKEKALAVNRTKLAALGELSAGIAHEIGNPLNAIQGRAEMLINISEKGKLDVEKTLKYSKIILNLCERMSKIINGLSSYSKDGSKDPVTKVNLSKVLDEIISFSTHKFRNNKIQVFREGINSTAIIEAREAEVAEVIINLLNNACDSLIESKKKEIVVRQGTKKSYYFFEISDTGSGVPDEVRESLYESFVTTKGANGTGLGLSLSKTIVQRYNGSISFSDNVDSGTCFRVEFPKAII